MPGAAPAQPGQADVVMALDLGEKRIGVALSNPEQTLAFPHGVINRSSRRRDFARYRQIIAQETVGLVVFGLPLTLAGEEGRQAAWVRDYAADFQTRLGVAIDFWDEGLTTREAQESLRASGASRQKAGAVVDAVAAAIILREYLAARRAG